AKINVIYRDVLKKFNLIESFLRHDINNHAFYASGISEYLIKHAVLHEDILKEIEDLTKTKGYESFEIDAKIDSIHALLRNYDGLFSQMVALLKERGYKDFGLVGKMRDNAHKLENITPRYQNFVLSLRRHEKDYMMRNELTYIEKLNALAAQLEEEFNRDRGLTEDKRHTYLQLLNEYQRLFNNMVEMDRRIGIRDNAGLKFQLDLHAEKIENAFVRIINDSARKKQEIF
ncbi:MAG: hypothetical protein HC896_11825, partial [Bacteroidales bacterium]|nr:hypothetical protein [Bacteroidales bacterium]